MREIRFLSASARYTRMPPDFAGWVGMMVMAAGAAVVHVGSQYINARSF